MKTEAHEVVRAHKKLLFQPGVRADFLEEALLTEDMMNQVRMRVGQN